MEKSGSDTNRETAIYLLVIPKSTINYIWAKRDLILYSPGQFRRRDTEKKLERWPGMELDLATQILKNRKKGWLISRGWFRRKSKALVIAIYGCDDWDFKFSYGWFSHSSGSKNTSGIPSRYGWSPSILPLFAMTNCHCWKHINTINQQIF